NGQTELGYWIAQPYWGRGFATEAARGVLEVARLLGHQRIEAG
ncbi:MAG TPA: GNAT family N-acetyltransferase, partial [Erythrobacter sp.]|nr:GNAT family N-acetyltransferase [Erythrobacter sp.]